MSQSVKAPFKFSYTQPSLDWFETINVEIKPDDYYYFKLQRRYGPDWWLIGQNPPPQKILHGTNGRKQSSGEFPAVTLQSLLSGRELTVVEAKLLRSLQLAALSTFFVKLKSFCLTPESPRPWRSNGAEI